MKQLTIQEWFARSVAAGLMPECNYAFAEYSESWHGVKEWSIYTGMTENCRDTILVRKVIEKPDDEEDARVSLRKDGKDLYLLEWRKPTEQDVGKMCWFANENSHRRIEIDAFGYLNKMCNEYNNQLCYFAYGSGYIHYYCLLADHGRLAPTEADFIKVYGV